MANAEENGMFTIARVGVVIALTEEGSALVRGHRGIGVVISVRHLAWIARGVLRLTKTRLIEVIVVMKRRV